MTSPHTLRSLAVTFLIALSTLTSRADVRLNGLFTDGMVLQEDTAVPIWGWADEGEFVNVQFRDQSITVKSLDGTWMARLRGLKAGGPDTLRVMGRNTLVRTNVMVGEVWLASGQSNMEWPLKLSHEPEVPIAQSANSQIRLFTVPKLKLKAPTNDVVGQWMEASPATVSNFSAVGYFFGRDLARSRGVPVGIIHTSWGGSPAEVWMSGPMLQHEPNHRREIIDSFATNEMKYEKALLEFEQAEAKAKREGKPMTGRRPSLGWRPSELYNGMIANLIPFSIKGVIWYQGESNADRAYQYRKLFTDLIWNWRSEWSKASWGSGNFTFLAVQLAPFKAIKDEPGESDWAELREAQMMAAESLPKVGTVSIVDLGDEKDIHPRKKEPVGARLALAARGIAYGEKIVYSGPQYRKAKFKGDQAIISFDHVGGGLEAREGVLKGFTIAGPDGKFVSAQAVIQGDQVIVSSPEVKKPIAVRFGWADYPVINLWNVEGLPASPFRTDEYPITPGPSQRSAK